MVSRLPRWVELGAFVLAVLAGCVNAVGFLGFQHQAVSHVSGTTTLLATELLQPSPQTGHLLVILLSFIAGSALSGILIEHTALKLGRHYSSVLLLEAVFLLIAMGLLLQGSATGHYFASAACGMQNAMVTTYSGAIVRTTHLTGLFTDLGLMIGAKIRGAKFDRRKAVLLILIMVGFVCGGLLGAGLYPLLGFITLSVPAAMAVVLALVYWRFTQVGQ